MMLAPKSILLRKLCLLTVAMLLFSGIEIAAQEMRVATFNLRYANPKDSGNLWADRVPVVAALIEFHDFDIFGTQEALPGQVNDLQNLLPGYSWYGVGRDDGKDKGEHSSIFFKKDKYQVINKGDFWLSQTPDKPSLGWDAICCFRICSWIKFKDTKTAKEFYFFNVHYDHQGVKAREESSKLMLQKINEIAGSAPVILTGDFNGSQTSSWYLALANSGILTDVYKAVPNPYAFSSSFNNFSTQSRSKDIIDHIFISKHFKAKKYGILTDNYYGKFPSDHFPVLSVISW